jgi:integrase
MPRLTVANPKYRKHRASGQAVVTLDGREFYLGPHGTKASHSEYDRLIGEWLANGRQLQVVSDQPPDLTVTELAAAFWRHAQDYYPDSPGEQGCFKHVLQILKRLYGRTPAAEFGPLALQAVQREMVAAGWCRKHVNRQTGRLRQVFKWATAREMVPASVHHALQAVAGLRRGKTEARETQPVQPVPVEHVTAVLPYVSRQVRAMIELQLVTGMRPGEVCAMRTADVDTTGKLWVYAPAKHKTAHHGHTRTIYLGPKAQQVLAEFLRTDLHAPVFAPADAEAERRAALHKARKTPMSCGNTPGTNRRAKPAKTPGAQYTRASYLRAIWGGCDRAFPPPAPLCKANGETLAERHARLTPKQHKELEVWRRDHRWHPNRLRHSAATFLRKEYGLEAAQVILGHKTLAVTEIYAEKNVAAAMRIMSAVG